VFWVRGKRGKLETTDNGRHVQTMKINEADKPNRGGDKYPVINLIIVHTHVQKDEVVMLYTRTCNKSATIMAPPVSIQNFSSTSRSPFKVACGHSITQRPATCDADHMHAEACSYDKHP
jgi:hypothetical protein